MSQILSYGPPVLTVEAADAAIDLIDFIAAQVRGVDLIDVTDVVRPLWRVHLAYWYPHLPPQTRQWFAAAQVLLTATKGMWSQYDPMRRAAFVQQWSFELPAMLSMLDPVLMQAQAAQMSQATAANLAAMRQQAAPQQPSSDADVMEQLANRRATTESLINYSTSMTNSTIDLMRAFNRR
jgi:hypothetical protein